MIKNGNISCASLRLRGVAFVGASKFALGNPGEFTILELAQKIIAMTGSKSQFVFRPLPADDPTQRKPDIALAKRILDWTPRVALDDGLIHAVAYFRDSGGGAP